MPNKCESCGAKATKSVVITYRHKDGEDSYTQRCCNYCASIAEKIEADEKERKERSKNVKMPSLICACGSTDTQPVSVCRSVGEEVEEYWCDNCIAELEAQYPADEDPQ